MQQIWIPRFGGPDVLEARTAPDPEVTAGHVRIRVAFSGLNFADLMARMGLYADAPPKPCVVGYEVSGTIETVGPGVSGFSAGQRVTALAHFGGHSSVVVVPATQVAILPDKVSFEAAAALPVNYLTAWLMLVHLGNVQKGDTVLVHSAAGGVGQAALQIGLHRGAILYGTASASKHERLRKAGFSAAIDYRTQDFEAEIKRITDGRGVDIVLDAVGGASFKKSYRSLAPLGRLYLFGAASIATGNTRSILSALKFVSALPTFRPLPLIDKNRGVQGINLGHLWSETKKLTVLLNTIVELTGQGVLAPVIDKVFPFSKAGEAHAYLQSRQSYGKVLLAPDPV